jgi:GTP-binding protein
VLGPYAAEPADVSVTLFSALSRAGVDDVAQTLHTWAAAHGAATAAPASRATDAESGPAASPDAGT